MRVGWRGLVVATITGLCLAFAPMPRASAVDVAAGMKLFIGRHLCSLGFFGFDSSGDRLAVTSGHCADALNQPVYSESRVKIGEVVARKPDIEDEAGRLTGSRGFTVIFLYKQFSIQPFFTRVGSIHTGDSVTKFGGRTGKTYGHIEKIKTNPDRPDLALIWSDMVQLPGDSGAPWYTSGPTLVGIGSSGDQEKGGGGAGCQAQPIGDVVKMIKAVRRYGNGFRVWIE